MRIARVDTKCEEPNYWDSDFQRRPAKAESEIEHFSLYKLLGAMSTKWIHSITLVDYS
jgi:hypothetical protein